MKIKNILQVLALAATLTVGTATAQETTAPAQMFEYPTVPDKLTKPAMRANFMVEHLWDKCDLEKTDITNLPAFHDAFTDYLSFFALADKAVVEKSIKKYVERVSKNQTNLNITVGLLYSEVINIYSQYCSDEVFGMFADNIVASKKVSKELKAKIQTSADMLKNSAEGAQMADFPLRQSPAGAASLYGLTADTTILFFNADGVDSSIYKVRLSANIAANDLIKAGKLRIVSVYSGDTDVDAKLASEPSDWEVAYIANAQQLYDQRIRPAVYVLDKDKKITVKFVAVDNMLQAVENVAHNLKQAE